MTCYLHRVEASASFFLTNCLIRDTNTNSWILQDVFVSFSLSHVHICKSESVCVSELFACSTSMYVCPLNRLEQQVQDKEKLERKLYSRFGMLLNEKKAKIRELQDDVRQLQSTAEPQRDVKTRQRSAGWCYMTSPDALANHAYFGTLKCREQ